MINKSNNAFSEFISQYPIYNNENIIPYDMSSKTVYGHKFFTPFDILQNPQYLLIDNTTLLDSSLLLGLEEGLITLKPNFINNPYINSEYETCIRMTEELVLYDKLVVDGFVFTNSPRAREVAKIFKDTIHPICFSHKDRINLHEFILCGYDDFKEKFNTYSYNDATFHDGKNIDLNFFESISKLNLTPPDNENSFIDIELTKYLRDSTLNDYRTAYYIALSEFCNLPYSPHHSRQLVLGSIMAKKPLIEKEVISYFERNVIDKINDKHKNMLNLPVSFKIPLIISSVISLMNKGAKYSDAVNEIRNINSAKGFRKWCMELNYAIKLGHNGMIERQKLLNELEKECINWQNNLDENYKYKTRNITLGVSTSIFNIEINKLKDPILWNQKKGLIFLNDLLRTSQRLSNLRLENSKIMSQFKWMKS